MTEDIGSISFAPSINTTIDLETLLPWSTPVSIPTANGERLVSKAKPTDDFWKLWDVRRSELQAAGITVRTWPKGSDKWEVCYWRPVPKEQLERRAEAIKASQAIDADIYVPGPEGYEYLGYQRAGIKFMLSRFGITPKVRQKKRD